MELKELIDLFEDIKLTSSDTLKRWRQTGVGKNRYSKLEVYGEYPSKSDFICPRAIPSHACWARIRINSNVRLVGFLLPDENGSPEFLDTFFVVFYDPTHSFYKL